jgi:hypothetical protein
VAWTKAHLPHGLCFLRIQKEARRREGIEWKLLSEQKQRAGKMQAHWVVAAVTQGARVQFTEKEI